MRLLFFGSPAFAVPALRALHGAGHRIARVVTRPDRPRGRHRTPAATPVKTAALELGLPLYQPASANSPGAVAELAGDRAELGVTAAYGEILCPELLSATPEGFLNVHPSLVPDYRGAAPVNWALIRGETVTGVSIIRMDPKLDAGPVLADRKVDIAPDESAGGLLGRLAEVGADLIVELVSRMDAGEPIEERRQPARGTFFARKLTKEDGRIDWSLAARDIVNRTRGLTPWPGAWCRFEGGQKSCRVMLLAASAEQGPGPEREPGTALSAGEDGIVVRAGTNAVRITRLKPDGGRAMSAADFVHGYHVVPGDRFVREL